MSKDEIKKAQAKLAELNLYHGKVDGLIGPLTRAAVMSFQALNGMARDGNLTPGVLVKLISGIATTGAISGSMKTNQAGIDLIKDFEKCKLTTYRDQKGILTIGWGLTSAAGLLNVKSGMTITRAEADAYLKKVLETTEQQVAEMVKRTPTDNQFSALVSFAYNAGASSLKKSTLLRLFNEGKIREAADAFRNWNKVTNPRTKRKEVSNGLVRRREAERSLFLR